MKNTVNTSDMIAYAQNLLTLAEKANHQAFAEQALACIKMIKELTGATSVEITEDGKLIVK